MKPGEGLVASLLHEVLGHSERERDSGGGEKSILRDSRVFVEQIEEIGKKWQEEADRKERQDEEVLLATFDISAMYPSLKIGYIIEEIDTILVERVESMSGVEKAKAGKLREVIIPLLIFLLEHQFVYVRSDEEGEKEKKIFYR